MPTLAVLSDTHWSRPEEYAERLDALFQGVDLIVHAGDSVDLFVLDRLKRIAPLVAVSGNCDREAIRAHYPLFRTFEAGGVEFGLTHGHRVHVDSASALMDAFPDEVRFIIHGHTHLPVLMRRGETTIFNPGSLSEPRGDHPPTWGRVRLDEGQITAEHVRF